MSSKSNLNRSRSLWCLMLPLLLLAFSGSWVSGCGTGADDGECPDTSFSKTNLDTLEAKNPKFIWRICNANEEYAMEEIVVPLKKDPISLGNLAPCKCSSYLRTDLALGDLEYYQGGEEYRFIYLANYWAVKGLVDSTSIKDAPGRYSYHFVRDTTEHFTNWVEIERETYY